MQPKEKGPLTLLCEEKGRPPCATREESATRFHAQVGTLVNTVAQSSVVIVEHLLAFVIPIGLLFVDLGLFVALDHDGNGGIDWNVNQEILYSHKHAGLRSGLAFWWGIAPDDRGNNQPGYRAAGGSRLDAPFALVHVKGFDTQNWQGVT